MSHLLHATRNRNRCRNMCRDKTQEVQGSWVYLGVRTCEVFLCFVTIMFVLTIVLTSLFSLFYVTHEGNRLSQEVLAKLQNTRPTDEVLTEDDPLPFCRKLRRF